MATEETMRETIARIAGTESAPASTSAAQPENHTEAPEGKPAGEAPAKPAESAPAKPAEKPAAEATPAKPAEAAPAKPTEPKPAAPKPAEAAKPGEKPAAPVPPKPAEQPVGLRAPESWKPAVREQFWGKLPPQVQAEIYRRERQIDEGLKASAEARRHVEEFSRLTTTFKDVFEYEKTPPLQSIANLLNINRTLRFAPAPQRAQLMAQVIQGFDVDVGLLDQALSMLVSNKSDPAVRAAQSQEQAMEALLAKHLKPVQEFMSTIQGTRQSAAQQAEAAMAAEIEAFANDEKNVYFDEVKDIMADIMEAGASRGQKISLQDAYQRAILSRNDLAGHVTQQMLQGAATTASSTAAQAAERASLSVTGAPSGSAAIPGGGTLRDDIEAAAARVAGR